MLYKRYFFLILSSVFCFIVFFIGVFFCLIYFADPFQTKSKGFFNSATERIGMRLQAQAIIKNVEFESAILGSSMSANTSAIEASQLLGESYVNLSIDGGNFFERENILKYALQHKNIKSIIYVFGDAYLYFPEDTQDLSRWELLYDDNFLNNFKVAYDKQYIRMALRNIVFQKKEKAKISYFDKPYALKVYIRLM